MYCRSDFVRQLVKRTNQSLPVAGEDLLDYNGKELETSRLDKIYYLNPF